MCDCGYGVRFGGRNLDETGEGVWSLQKEIRTFNLSFSD
jgi:hypothetical protein